MGAPDPKPLGRLYAAIGLAAVAASTAASITRGVARAAAPLGRAVLHPPVLAQRLHPSRAVEALADRGREVMSSTGVDLERVVAVVVPAVVREVLDRLDLNAVIRDRVDLDLLAATVDIAEIIERVDLDAVVRRVDLDAVAERIDIDAIADRIDLDRIIARLDIDAIVAEVDLNAIVDRLNVVGLAEEVLNEIDVPEIIRESTGSLTSQVVRDARMRSIDADEVVSRLVDRLLRRRRPRSTGGPIQPRAEADSISPGESQP